MQMPRQARKKSRSEIYHILLRGINRQIIFEDDEDSEFFLKVVGKYKKEYKCQIYAYCLMKNHIHLLIKISNDELHNFMRKIGAMYVYWYNWKYNRVGGLFQGRYKSEPVEEESYFLTVLRYIHQNPVKAEICKNISDYEYSSYNQYINLKIKGITDAGFALEMLGGDRFKEFNHQMSKENCLDIQNVSRLNDDMAREIIANTSGCTSTAQFQLLRREIRNNYLAELKKNGLSVRQIERLTGINRGLVQKA